MTNLRRLRFIRSTEGSSAAEFALVLPIFLLFLLGIIDVGRFIWAVNENAKAAQVGARWAVATNNICSGLTDWSFAINQSPAITQGTVVPKSAFPGVRFPGGASTTCTCMSGGTCSFPLTADRTAFLDMVGRMNRVQPRLGPANVSVQYDWSGLGFSGDPNGADVAPIVTVSVSGLQFRPLFLASSIGFTLPGGQFSLTMEDGKGNFANY